METSCTLFIHMLMHYKPSMSLLCFCRKFPPTPFFWFLLLLILLSNASANGVKQKAINFFSSFIPSPLVYLYTHIERVYIK